MQHFCTYFDINYLSRGLALYTSLREHSGPFALHVLCMDEAAFTSISELGLPGLIPIALSDLERADPGLLEAKSNRSRIEYYFTCTAALPLYIMRQRQDAKLVTYLDADLFFFASPDPLFDELGTGSVAIVGHRFPPSLKDREKYGLYNVGWLSFRRDSYGLACLEWWRARCIEWCYDRVEEGRFADQKYLDDWPTRFPGVVTLSHPGANLAPWNIENHSLSFDSSRMMVDGKPLIFFHFHGLKQIGRWLYDPGWKEYGVNPSRTLHKWIYLPYIRVLRQVGRSIRGRTRSLPAGVRRIYSEDTSGSGLGRIRSCVRQLRDKATEISRGSLILCFADRSDATINDLA